MTALFTPPPLTAPSHPLVATQLQIKDARVLGDFTEPRLAAAISSWMSYGAADDQMSVGWTVMGCGHRPC